MPPPFMPRGFCPSAHAFTGEETRDGRVSFFTAVDAGVCVPRPTEPAMRITLGRETMRKIAARARYVLNCMLSGREKKSSRIRGAVDGGEMKKYIHTYLFVYIVHPRVRIKGVRTAAR